MEDNDTDSLIFKNVDTKQNHDQDTLSAEDLAWADSCLIEDPEISETNMDSLNEALLYILDQHSEIHGASANEQANSNDKIDPENSHLVIEEVTSHTAEKSVDQDVKQESHDAISILKKQPFLPNFNDDMMNIQYSDDDDDAGFVLSEFVTEPRSDEDIFKVWDLDIPVEEDELDKQLKEALSSDADNTRAPKMKGLKMESLDSLVESIADLSIK
ncbi:hypothetical protein L1987_06244 [Smallanthus sonchifolius]|uniref:Uncharacterized protein n=1 Tax=Smallanthus sonchifolius TaxID=185202 RepID=A0ACB9JXL9_9ASTR|nr:hypothetical protein L1987_06244 [Smallanthus sonchifolius]